LLERKLQKSGYIIESAASMPEAEYVLSLFKPHLVILDINVAGDDGRQLCWKIKNTGNNRDAKVILMSGYNYTINRHLLFGAEDYVAKPFQSEYLMQKMETLLAVADGEPAGISDVDQRFNNQAGNYILNGEESFDINGSSLKDNLE